jgi:hypothetical protein
LACSKERLDLIEAFLFVHEKFVSAGVSCHCYGNIQVWSNLSFAVGTVVFRVSHRLLVL